MATKKTAPKSAAKAAPAKKTAAANKPAAAKKPAAKTPAAKMPPPPKAPAGKKAAPVPAKAAPKKGAVEAKPAAKAPAKAPVKAAPAPAKGVVKAAPKAAPKAAEKVPAKAPAPPAKPAPKPVETKEKATVSAPSKAEVKPSIRPLAKPESAKASPAKSGPPKPVVIPKTSTDKAIKYEPEFTKSVLDTPHYEPSAPSLRYSDNELQEFRELINKKLETAKKELAYLQGLITRKDEGDMEDGRYMTMEDGSMSMEREQLSQMASRQIQFIDHLEKAIMRIENKTYGICRVTGKLIDKARLRAVPHATLSIEAKQMRK